MKLLKTIIVDRYETLTPELQKAANYTAAHGQEVAVNSMRSVAQLAQVKPATLLRLSKALGFDGWQQLKDQQLKELGLLNNTFSQSQYKNYTDKAKRLITNENHYHSMSNEIKNNLDVSYDLNINKLNQAATMMKSANNIYICGFRASFSLAYYLFYVTRLFKNNLSLIDGLAGNIELYPRIFQPNDVVVIIGYAPLSREIKRIFEIAKKRQSKIIMISDNSVSQWTIHADVNLQSPTEGSSFFPLLSAGMAVIEQLIVELIHQEGEKAISVLENTEQLFQSENSYLSD